MRTWLQQLSASDSRPNDSLLLIMLLQDAHQQDLSILALVEDLRSLLSLRRTGSIICIIELQRPKALIGCLKQTTARPYLNRTHQTTRKEMIG
jgi:hypothetical protein